MISVAIDGPAGAGKSTIARAAAEKLGFIYVDTGALYRAIGLNCIKNNVDINDPAKVAAILPDTEIRVVFFNGEQRVLLGGDDVSEEIRSEKASMTASVVSAIPEVRKFLLDLQRSFAKVNSVIMDGRDIGTVVLPNASVKIFLTASPQSRAERRVNQLREKGLEADYETILKDIMIRDENDTNRSIAPLKPAEDSVLLDTTKLTLQQSIESVSL